MASVRDWSTVASIGLRGRGAGVSRATGLPRRVISIESPAWTRSLLRQPPLNSRRYRLVGQCRDDQRRVGSSAASHQRLGHHQVVLRDGDQIADRTDRPGPARGRLRCQQGWGWQHPLPNPPPLRGRGGMRSTNDDGRSPRLCTPSSAMGRTEAPTSHRWNSKPRTPAFYRSVTASAAARPEAATDRTRT